MGRAGRGFAPRNYLLRLVIQSQDAAAATALRAKWQESLWFDCQAPDIQEHFPNLLEASDGLTPRVEGSQTSA